MCGVFGWVSTGGKGPDMKALKAIAKVTMRRGSHAWGMAWVGQDGRLRMFKRTGRITDSLGLLMMAADARYLIGHCRFATHGAPENNSNNHPHPADGGWIVHNGVIHDHERIADHLGRDAVTHCDSEVLGMLVEEGVGRLMERCADASDAAGRSPFVMLGLWKPGRLVAVRRGNPLHLATTKGGRYLASLADGMPGEVREVEDQTVTEFTKGGAEYASLQS